jgi:hypothetical protein
MACGQNPRMDGQCKLCSGCFGKWLNHASLIIARNRKLRITSDSHIEFEKWVKGEQENRREKVRFT